MRELKLRARAAKVRCMGKEWMAVDVGKTVTIEDDGIEVLGATFAELVNRWRYVGCEVEELSVTLGVFIAPGRRLVELPTGHIVAV